MSAISTEAIVLTLAGALAWALLDFTRKLLASSAPAVATAFVLVLGQIPLFLVWVVLHLEPGAPVVPQPAYWLPGIAATLLNLLVAAVVGITVPVTMNKFGRDPALGSSVLLTFTTDSMGFFIFLGLATVFLL